MRTNLGMGRRSTVASALLLLAGAIAIPSATAQDLGGMLKRTVQRAAQDEARRKVDQETRKATRCALGDTRCNAQAETRTTAARNGATASGGGSDHPLVPRYQDARIVRHEAEDYTDYPLRTGKAKTTGTQLVEGRLTRITYEGPQQRSVLEVFRNYEAQLQRDGFTVVYQCAREQCGDIRKAIESGPRYMLLWGGGEHRYLAARRKDARGEAHVAVYVTRNESGGPARGRAMVQVDVVESGAMESRMAVVDAAELRGSLARDGHVSLYGIQFDLDRDTLRPDSAEQITQIALLLQQDPALSVRVVGHTDNQGSARHNLDLSRRRASRVVEVLAGQHGIARRRLEASGVGASTPVADNATEEGRARNRRVEIVKR